MNKELLSTINADAAKEIYDFIYKTQIPRSTKESIL